MLLERWRRVAVTALCASAGAATAPAGAVGAWTQAAGPADVAGQAREPHQTVAADGSGVTAWLDARGVAAVVGTPGDHRGARESVAGPARRQANLRLAQAASGEAALVWQQRDPGGVGLYAAVRRQHGAFGPRRLVARNAFVPTVAFARDGSAALVARIRRRIMLWWLAPGGRSFGRRPLTLTSGGTENPRVAFDRRSVATVAWSIDRGADLGVARVSRRRGRLDLVRVVSGPGRVEDLRLSVAGDGTAALTWKHRLPDSAQSTDAGRAALRPAGRQAFLRPVPLGLDPQRVPGVVAEPDGRWRVAFNVAGTMFGRTFDGRRAVREQELGEGFGLSALAGTGSAGATLAAWPGPPQSGQRGHQLFVAGVDPGGGFAPTEALPVPAGVEVHSDTQPSVGVAGRHAAVTFLADGRDGRPGRVLVSRRLP